jgi:hypothetical protein
MVRILAEVRGVRRSLGGLTGTCAATLRGSLSGWRPSRGTPQCDNPSMVDDSKWIHARSAHQPSISRGALKTFRVIAYPIAGIDGQLT